MDPVVVQYDDVPDLTRARIRRAARHGLDTELLAEQLGVPLDYVLVTLAGPGARVESPSPAPLEAA